MTDLAARIADAVSASGAVVDALAGVDRVEAFRALDRWTYPVLRQALCTVNRFDAESMTVVRLYSSDPASYPPGGSKQKRGTPWGEHVLVQRRVYVGEGADAIRASFDDHAAILALGLQSVINVPVVAGGQCLGTVNFLMREARIDPAHVSFARLAAQLAAPAFPR